MLCITMKYGMSRNDEKFVQEAHWLIQNKSFKRCDICTSKGQKKNHIGERQECLERKKHNIAVDRTSLSES